ncbi:MAG: hypothetical protein ACR2J4_06530 [Deinococcus sp.]
MVKEIWLIHHSHTDIGFTHPQPIIFELHRRYIDEVLDLIDSTRDLPDAARFRWTCETTGIAWDWWRRAHKSQRSRFLAAAQEGSIEVAALRWNMTPLADHALLADQLREAQWLRAEGLTIRSAMQSDVNGMPWGTVRALLDHGIDGFSMAINEHFGRAVSPRPGAFWWASPEGDRILTWNGPHYHSTPNRAMRISGPLAEAIPATEAYLSRLNEHGYGLSVLAVQPTHIYFADNDAPDANLPDFVRQWNDSGQVVSMRLATLSQFMDRLRQEPADLIPTQSGDWTDWWNFGAGSTARETRLHMQGQRDLAVARQVQVWSGYTPRFGELSAQAADALTLYAEHTWGADWQAATPSSDETAIQLSHKLEYAYQGVTLARFLKRDALLQLARQLPGDGPSLLAYNPQPFEVTSMLRVPENTMRYVPNMAHLAQRFDVEWNGRMGKERWVGPVTLPALGYAVLPLEAQTAEAQPMEAGLPTTPTGLGAALSQDALEASSTGLHHADGSIGNGLVTARFDTADGGVLSLEVDGRDFARTDEALARLVLERPDPARRNAIFGPPQWEAFDMHGAWHQQWQALREYARVEGTQSRALPGAVEHEQQLSFTNRETASVLYRLHPGQTALHVLVTLRLNPDTTPRATYLNLPLALAPSALTHFETAGATVEFDREQLPGSSRHYITTLDWLRMQDDKAGVTVATPDAPLWQVGGFTFGRFDGEKRAPYEATLNGWLTNNYWDTNFKADQAGELRFEFTLSLHIAEGLAASAQRARTFISRPEIQVFTAATGGEPVKQQLLDVQMNGVCLTGIGADAEGRTLTLQVFNPADETRSVEVAAGRYQPTGVVRRSLAGMEEARGEHTAGRYTVSVPGRLWCELSVQIEQGDTAR